jgi:hypothetical protein
LKDLGIEPRGFTADERDALLKALSDVHLEIDREDLAYAEELLARRKAGSVDAIVSETTDEEAR